MLNLIVTCESIKLKVNLKLSHTELCYFACTENFSVHTETLKEIEIRFNIAIDFHRIFPLKNIDSNIKDLMKNCHQIKYAVIIAPIFDPKM